MQVSVAKMNAWYHECYQDTTWVSRLLAKVNEVSLLSQVLHMDGANQTRSAEEVVRGLILLLGRIQARKAVAELSNNGVRVWANVQNFSQEAAYADLNQNNPRRGRQPRPPADPPPACGIDLPVGPIVPRREHRRARSRSRVR